MYVQQEQSPDRCRQSKHVIKNLIAGIPLPLFPPLLLPSGFLWCRGFPVLLSGADSLSGNHRHAPGLSRILSPTSLCTSSYTDGRCNQKGGRCLVNTRIWYWTTRPDISLQQLISLRKPTIKPTEHNKNDRYTHMFKCDCKLFSYVRL